MEHLEEFRKRLISVVIVLVLTTVVAFSIAPQLFEFLRLPLKDLSDYELIVLSPLEMFITYFKLAFTAGIFLTVPWILVQIWLFVAPGLYKNEKRWIFPFVFLGTSFFVGGAAFGFYIVLPMGFKYLVAMVPASVVAQYSVSTIFTLVLRIVIAFGIVFELPLVMWVLAAARFVSPEAFSSFRKYWVVVAVVLAAILTPPDPFTQMMMALPLWLFFELGIIGARMLYRRPDDKNKSVQ